MDDGLTPSWPPATCPRWCARDHGPTDHPEDRRHQSNPHLASLEVATTSPPGRAVRSDEVVVYADQLDGTGEALVRLESIESTSLRLALSRESARTLAEMLLKAAGVV